MYYVLIVASLDVCTLRSRFPFHIFFFNATSTTEIYTLSLHDALPISSRHGAGRRWSSPFLRLLSKRGNSPTASSKFRSEEHTSELQSHSDLVCRLLLEKKKRNTENNIQSTNRFHLSARTNTTMSRHTY